MKEKKRNLLYFTRTMNLGGTENVILQLCKIMKPEMSKIIVCSSGGVNVEELNRMGITHYNIPDIEKKDVVTIFKVLRTLIKIVRKENINIVHTHHRMAAFYTRLLSFIKNFIFVHNAHNTFNDKKWFTKFSLENSHIIAVGEKVKENLCDFYKIDKSKVTVIYNAVEEFKQKVIPIDLLEQYRSEGYFLVGNIGRLSEQKGMEYFIKAIPEIIKNYKMIKFFIVGDGEDKSKIERLIIDLNIENSVFMLGYRNDIQNVMSQLDIIVLSSLWEGLPLTPIEAFSVGKTVVATAVDGTTEIVNDRINGVLIDSRDSSAIANSLLDLLQDTEKIKLYEKNAYRKYKEVFSFEILRDKYREYYNKLIR